ncbi:MAG: hypothetical protein O2948_04820 [Proteobacteria bacterium]|nr:hypothetical protein [Pseudomonadota bacterium]MDA0926445.1 hypothetical protein [Pseudomonadota bacterium]
MKINLETELNAPESRIRKDAGFADLLDIRCLSQCLAEPYQRKSGTPRVS